MYHNGEFLIILQCLTTDTMYKLDLQNEPILLRNLEAVIWSEFVIKLCPPRDYGLTDQESELNLNYIEKLPYDHINSLKIAFETVAPFKTKIQRKSVPWWSKELSKLRRKVKKAERKVKKTQCADYREAYYSSKREYRRVIEVEKRHHWCKRCTRLDSQQALRAAIQHQKGRNNYTICIYLFLRRKRLSQR
uniref:Uncharacterized protein n=1 Tax=Lepeophtheirus salmonis TaxID=72036 RepID=A0A0K2V2G2_LEPSM